VSIEAVTVSGRNSDSAGHLQRGHVLRSGEIKDFPGFESSVCKPVGNTMPETTRVMFHDSAEVFLARLRDSSGC
jgi:hypothetical protein